MERYFLKKMNVLGIGEIELHTKVTIIHGRSIFGVASSKQYFETIVLPNLQEFYEDSLNPRKAINACISLYHLADWHWILLSQKDRRVQKEHIPYNDALECIANGAKHFNTHKNYQSGEIDGSYTERTLTLNCGEKIVPLKMMLEEIEKFWKKELN